MKLPFVILVEGSDDVEVFRHLCRKHDLNFLRENDEGAGLGLIKNKEGYPNLIDSLENELKASDLEVLAIVVDADEDGGLPVQPAHLPSAEAQQHGEHYQGHQARPEQSFSPPALAGRVRGGGSGGHVSPSPSLSRRAEEGIQPGHNPISEARCRNCSATSAAFAGRISRIASGIVTTGHSTACTQSGGEKWNSTQNAMQMTMAPSTMITPTAPASPVSDPPKLSPQTGQAGLKVSSPLNNLPFPHLGQRQRMEASRIEISRLATEVFYSAAI